MQKIGIKLIIIGMVCLAFFIGLMFISSLVDERQAYHDDVISDIKSSHVSSQLMATPFLIAQYGDDTHYIFPTTSDIKAEATVRDDEYKRGIYRAVSYGAKINTHQTFDPAKTTSYTLEMSTPAESDQTDTSNITVSTNPDTAQTPPATTNTSPKATKRSEPSSVSAPLKLIIAVSDLRGVVPTHVVINGTSYPATFNRDNALSISMPYLETQLPLTQEEFFNGKVLDVRFGLDVSGIGGFGVMPLGEMSHVSLNSNWQNPKFSGQALPTQKSWTDDGFGATWQAHALGIQNQRLIMQIAQGTMGSFEDYTNYALMTDFIHVNDTYTKTDRTIKYALLLIMISFGTFFLFEVIKARVIHPIQYLLVASALLVFYLLLLSLAEQIAFLYAYVIASIACVGLIGWYACYMLGSALRGMGFGAVLGSLYAAFYVILSASELNLLMGSIFSFICIAVFMAVTRHVDWHGLAEKSTNKDEHQDDNLPPNCPNTPLTSAVHEHEVAKEATHE